jgi:hypothetical protein
MAFKSWFSRPTPLRLALDRGTRPGGKLADELRNLGDYKFGSESDAQLICEVLTRMVPTDSTVGGESALHSLVALFQNAEGRECPAFDVLATKGIPLLVQIADETLKNPSSRDRHDVLFVLKILAMFGNKEGTDAVLRAARLPLYPDAWMWSIILREYSQGHPQRQRLFEGLRDPLPSNFLAVSLLDTANAAHLEGDGFPHPFDSPAGKRELEKWLTDPHEEHFSYAVSAAAALPFISDPERNGLIAIGFDHPSKNVQLETAWVAAKLGREAGIRWLAQSCTDVHLCKRAKQYLSELGRADAIPGEAEDASFQAKAEFAQWLAHPSELGRPPDELQIIDHRVLDWPPDREPTKMWLIRYRVKDDTGLKPDDADVGLVGSVTFCLFSYKLNQRPPEDCYAIHCYWEMSHAGLITEATVEDDSTEYDELLRQCNLDGAKQAKIILVVEPSPALKYPRKLVALARANRQGEPGWIVVDGLHSRWYAAAEMPADVPEKTVVMVHLGRFLLGFNEQADRRAFLRSGEPSQDPDQVIAAYERLLGDARRDHRQATRLLTGHSILGTAFDDYVAALAAARSRSEAACTSTAYESLLAATTQVDLQLRGKVFECFSPLGEAFDRYINALIELNRQAEVPALVAKFRPHWDHNLGYGKLGSAAFRSGHDQIAEIFLHKLRHSDKDWCRSREMELLAEIWKKQGRIEDAHCLLIDAMKALHEQSRTATGSDRRLFEDWFQTRRSAYLKLFPERGDDELQRQGIELSTLSKSGS